MVKISSRIVKKKIKDIWLIIGKKERLIKTNKINWEDIIKEKIIIKI